MIGTGKMTAGGPDICTENPIEQLLNNYRTTIEQL